MTGRRSSRSRMTTPVPRATATARPATTGPAGARIPPRQGTPVTAIERPATTARRVATTPATAIGRQATMARRVATTPATAIGRQATTGRRVATTPATVIGPAATTGRRVATTLAWPTRPPE